MTYEDVKHAVFQAWGAFEQRLKDEGFTHQQVVEFTELLDCKDGYSAVIDAAMEASR